MSQQYDSEPKIFFYPVYGHHNFVQESYHGRFAVNKSALEIVTTTQEIFCFPGTTGMTNSKIRLYSWPKYSTTVLIMKLGVQVSEYQPGVCLTVSYKYSYY